MTIATMLSAHHDAVAASVVGGAAGVAAAAGAVPVPPGAPDWLAWVAALGVGVAPFLVSRLLAGVAAFPRALAVEREKRAAALLADDDKGNDQAAGALLDDAAKLRAVAEAIDAAANKRNGKGGEA